MPALSHTYKEQQTILVLHLLTNTRSKVSDRWECLECLLSHIPTQANKQYWSCSCWQTRVARSPQRRLVHSHTYTTNPSSGMFRTSELPFYSNSHDQLLLCFRNLHPIAKTTQRQQIKNTQQIIIMAHDELQYHHREESYLGYSLNLHLIQWHTSQIHTENKKLLLSKNACWFLAWGNESGQHVCQLCPQVGVLDALGTPHEHQDQRHQVLNGIARNVKHVILRKTQTIGFNHSGELAEQTEEQNRNNLSSIFFTAVFVCILLCFDQNNSWRVLKVKVASISHVPLYREWTPLHVPNMLWKCVCFWFRYVVFMF